MSQLQRSLVDVTGFWAGCIGVAVVACYLAGVGWIMSVVLK